MQKFVRERPTRIICAVVAAILCVAALSSCSAGVSGKEAAESTQSAEQPNAEQPNAEQPNAEQLAAQPSASEQTSSSATSVRADLSTYPVADMSGFAALADEQNTIFVDVSVADVAQLMEANQSFVLFCANPGCPWCESMIGALNEVAQQQGWQIAFINTRKDPSWTSNLDIDDYETFVELFGEYLELDEQGRPHLYVPELLFVREGKVVAQHQGVLSGYDDPSVPLSDEQYVQLTELLTQYFALF